MTPDDPMMAVKRSIPRPVVGGLSLLLLVTLVMGTGDGGGRAMLAPSRAEIVPRLAAEWPETPVRVSRSDSTTAQGKPAAAIPDSCRGRLVCSRRIGAPTWRSIDRSPGAPVRVALLNLPPPVAPAL